MLAKFSRYTVFTLSSAIQKTYCASQHTTCSERNKKRKFQVEPKSGKYGITWLNFSCTSTCAGNMLPARAGSMFLAHAGKISCTYKISPCMCRKYSCTCLFLPACAGSMLPTCVGIFPAHTKFLPAHVHFFLHMQEIFLHV